MAGPRWAKGVTKLNPKVMPSKARLKSAHTASSEAVGRWIAAAIDEGVKMKNDAHHRGNILLTLKLSGHKVDADTQYGIWWSWHKKARRGIS